MVERVGAIAWGRCWWPRPSVSRSTLPDDAALLSVTTPMRKLATPRLAEHTHPERKRDFFLFPACSLPRRAFPVSSPSDWTTAPVTCPVSSYLHDRLWRVASVAAWTLVPVPLSLAAFGVSCTAWARAVAAMPIQFFRLRLPRFPSTACHELGSRGVT